MTPCEERQRRLALIEITRRDNESELDYHKRLVYGKLVDHTLSDMDYAELSELMYGKRYSSDVARRMAYGSRYTLELLDSQRIDNVTKDNIASEINDKIIELQKQTQRTRDQAREYRKMMNSDGRWEHLRDELLEAAKRLPDSVGTIFEPSDVTYTLPDSENEAILVLSDWHYGMITNNAFNEYNTEICKARVRTTIEKAKERIVLHGCNKLYIVFLGDGAHGHCHTGTRVASEELVVDQLLQVAEILAQTVLELYSIIPNIEVHCTYGNHLRVMPNKTDNIHRDNWERVIPSWLEQRIAAECWKRNEDLNISIAPDTGTEFCFIRACGHDIVAVHGDLDSPRSATQLLPSLLRTKFHLNVEYILLGDKHHRESFEGLNATARICGSLCSTDEYANTKRLYSQPSQLLLIVNEVEGIDAEYALKCE